MGQHARSAGGARLISCAGRIEGVGIEGGVGGGVEGAPLGHRWACGRATPATVVIIITIIIFIIITLITIITDGPACCKKNGLVREFHFQKMIRVLWMGQLLAKRTVQ